MRFLYFPLDSVKIRPGTVQREISSATGRPEPQSTDAPTGAGTFAAQKLHYALAEGIYCRKSDSRRNRRGNDRFRIIRSTDFTRENVEKFGPTLSIFFFWFLLYYIFTRLNSLREFSDVFGQTTRAYDIFKDFTRRSGSFPDQSTRYRYETTGKQSAATGSIVFSRWLLWSHWKNTVFSARTQIRVGKHCHSSFSPSSARGRRKTRTHSNNTRS